MLVWECALPGDWTAAARPLRCRPLLGKTGLLLGRTAVYLALQPALRRDARLREPLGDRRHDRALLRLPLRQLPRGGNRHGARDVAHSRHDARSRAPTGAQCSPTPCPAASATRCCSSLPRSQRLIAAARSLDRTPVPDEPRRRRGRPRCASSPPCWRRGRWRRCWSACCCPRSSRSGAPRLVDALALPLVVAARRGHRVGGALFGVDGVGRRSVIVPAAFAVVLLVAGGRARAAPVSSARSAGTGCASPARRRVPSARPRSSETQSSAASAARCSPSAGPRAVRRRDRARRAAAGDGAARRACARRRHERRAHAARSASAGHAALRRVRRRRGCRALARPSLLFVAARRADLARVGQCRRSTPAPS